jgi:penicillin-binding protein 1C
VRWLPVPDGREEPERRVMSPGAAALLLDVLQDPVARIPGFGPVTPLEFPFPAAAKTGTSRHFTDNWAVAVTGGFTVAVWAGNFDGRPMEGVSGITGAGPLLHRAALLVARRHSPGVLPTPESVGARAVGICRLSGLRAGPRCPVSTEWFLPGTAPDHECDWHQPGGLALPAQYADWAASARRALVVGEHSAARAAPDSALAGFRITTPVTGDVLRFVPGVDPRYATIGLRAAGGGVRPAEVRWFVDGRRLEGARFRLVAGRHRIRAAAGRLGDEVVVEVIGDR